jgi:hypothetical protein
VSSAKSLPDAKTCAASRSCRRRHSPHPPCLRLVILGSTVARPNAFPHLHSLLARPLPHGSRQPPLPFRQRPSRDFFLSSRYSQRSSSPPIGVPRREVAAPGHASTSPPLRSSTGRAIRRSPDPTR